MEVFETYFSDTVITYNDHPRYVKHVSAYICDWVQGGGGGSQGIGTQAAYVVFHPGQLKHGSFRNLLF